MQEQAKYMQSGYRNYLCFLIKPFVFVFLFLLCLRLRFHFTQSKKEKSKIAQGIFQDMADFFIFKIMLPNCFRIFFLLFIGNKLSGAMPFVFEIPNDRYYYRNKFLVAITYIGATIADIINLSCSLSNEFIVSLLPAKNNKIYQRWESIKIPYDFCYLLKKME